MELLVKEIPYIEPIMVAEQLPDNSNFILFDSAKRSSQGIYSFLCYDPFCIITCEQGISFVDGVPLKKHILEILSEKLELFEDINKQNVPFYGGLAGYFGYEFTNYLEPRIKLLKKDDQSFPDVMMGMFDVVIAFDHHERKSWIYSSGLPETQENSRKKRAIARCEEMLKHIALAANFPPKTKNDIYLSSSLIKPNISFVEYCSNINKVLDYIKAGDIYQANISQCFMCNLPSDLSAMAIYLRLRESNPAPFSSFLQLNDNIIASTSPERFISARDGMVRTSPIKGTSKRDADPAFDESLALMLQQCEKNRAENLMIVDLLRNDLSKVCELFSVQVPELFSVESFANVHHLVSMINGKLKKKCNVFDLINASFPGGSITGAPKIRSIEIIDKIEKNKRGPYCGCIGYFSSSINMDTAILIRTFMIKKNSLSFHVGGGIVADSKPEEEYQETLLKAKALLTALTNDNFF